MTPAFDDVDLAALPEPLGNPFDRIEIRERVTRPLQKQHRNADVLEMIRALFTPNAATARTFASSTFFESGRLPPFSMYGNW